MNKEIKILIIESSRFKVLLDAAIEGLEGKSPLTNEKLAIYLKNRLKDIEEEILEIKNQE